ncbi:MAG: hypothetical protein H7833_05785 [Magnetococcus sp. DMHC-1]|nr:hypothetical protein [Magnetococcales bacterium]
MIDPGSETWQTVSQWAKEELRHCQDDIAVSCPMEDTERLRGRIQTLTTLLNLARPRRPIIATSEPDYHV